LSTRNIISAQKYIKRFKNKLYLTNINNSMEKIPSLEASSHSAIQKIPLRLWTLKFHYYVHKSPPLFPVLSQMNSFHNFPSCLPKIH
jgi:hypothetical protein